MNRSRKARSVRSRAINRSTSACMSGLWGRVLAAAPRGERCADAVELVEQDRYGRKGAVALQHYGERLRGSRGDLAEEVVDRLVDGVQVVVEQVALVAVRRRDPAAARDMNAADPIERNSRQEVERIETEVGRIGMEIVQVEQQPAAAVRHDARDPIWLAQAAAGRLDQGCDVLHRRHGADDCGGLAQVARRALGRGLAARRRGEMPDLNAAGAHEGEVLGPGFRFDLVDETGQPVEPSRVDRLRAGHAKRDGMDVHRHAACDYVERAAFAAAAVEMIVGDELEHVDPVERVKNTRRQLGPPSEAYAIPLHPPPQPALPPPPLLQLPSPPPPAEAARSRKSWTNGKAVAGSEATPNSAVSHSSPRDPLPARSDDLRRRSPANMERMLARNSFPAGVR